MTGNGRHKVQEQEKNHHVKQKSSSKAQVKKDEHNPSDDQHEKVAKKKISKTRPKKDVHNPLDRIRQMEPQKERNHVVCQQNNKQPDRSSPQTTPSQIHSQVTEKVPAQVCPNKSSSPALERTKKLDSADKAKLLRRQQSSITPKKVRNVVPLQLTLRNITVPLQFTYDENQASSRTMLRAQALLETAQQSRLNTPQATAQILQGLSALASDQLPPKQIKPPEMVFTGKNYVIGCNVYVPPGEVEANCLKDNVSRVVVPEVSESTEPRQVSLFEDWRLGSQKLLKPLSVDRGQRQQQEIERQQDRRFAQKIAMRKKELRYFRRLEGVGRDIDDDANTTTPSKATQSIANFPIREDVEESARGYAKFLCRPGAAWRNMSSDSASISTIGPNLNMGSESESTRLSSGETKKSTTEIVGAISSANAKRETMRKELAQRLQVERIRKKLLLSQDRAASTQYILAI